MANITFKVKLKNINKKTMEPNKSVIEIDVNVESKEDMQTKLDNIAKELKEIIFQMLNIK